MTGMSRSAVYHIKGARWNVREDKFADNIIVLGISRHLCYFTLVELSQQVRIDPGNRPSKLWPPAAAEQELKSWNSIVSERRTINARPGQMKLFEYFAKDSKHWFPPSSKFPEHSPAIKNVFCVFL